MQCPYCSSPVSSTAQVCRTCGGRLNQSQHLPAGTILDRKYRIERVLSQGGFGITYQAVHTTLGQTVAVKEYFPQGAIRQGPMVSTTLGGGEEFLAEGQRLARLQHPGIVRVQDILSENNTIYLVMEFVSGKSLKQVLEDKGQLSEADAITYIRKAAEALEVVHQAGLLHQDLKPDNLMLADDGRIVLIDFGASRHFLSDKTGNYTRVVTPGYGPLEQYGSNVKRGPYTDIYALGATLYTLLTGQTPPAAPDRVHDPDLPHLMCSPKVKKVIERAMEISYLKRQQSVGELIQMLPGKISHTANPSPNPAQPQQVLSPPPVQRRDITQDLAKGGSYQLGKGTYYVRGPVVLGGDLELVGEGHDTVIKLEIIRLGVGIHCPQGRKIVLKGVRLILSGKAKSGVWVEGQYDLEAMHLKGNGQQEVGLRIGKVADGSLVRSHFSGMKIGVRLEGNAVGWLSDNICEGNTYHGIQVTEMASPTLESNLCKGNQSCGIAYVGEAQGLATNNICEDNAFHGIQVGEKASPTLEGNTCRNNKHHGIVFKDDTSGTAFNNQCSGHFQFDIAILDRATVALQNNSGNTNKWG